MMNRRWLLGIGSVVVVGLAVLYFGWLLPAQRRMVTKVVTVAKPESYNGPCPTKLAFTGTIFVSRYPATVEYQWERSDGARGERQRVEIRSAGQGVTETWWLNAPGKHLQVWEKLHLLAPTGMSSDPATVVVNCR